nr:hypothetical protein [Tanacetum cinerariifolium]
YNANIRATNILLQGFPKDIYTFINHYTDAKDIWDNVKMLLEGSELTKEDQESQLMQLNSKFVNNMLPEWGRFVTAVKLNRGLRDYNYDQLYAYLKQHEAHANENKMMLDRFTQYTMDHLALMSNVSHPQHYSPSSSTLPSTYGRQNRGQGTNPCGGGPAGYGGVQNRVRNANTGQARQVKCYNCNGIWHIARNYIQSKRPQNSDYYKDKMLLICRCQPVQDLALNVDNMFQVDDCDAFDYDVDEAPMAQTMFMVNLSSADLVYDEAGPSYDSNILFEQASSINHNKLMVEEVTSLKKDFKQKENKYHEDFLDMKSLKEKVKDRLFKKDQSLQTVHMLCRPKPYYNELNKVAIGYKNPLCLTHAKKVQPALYNSYEIIKDNHVPAIVHNTEDTLEIARITRRKIDYKMKDPECVNHKVKITPHDYSKEKFLATFAPQKQLTPEQIFWSQDLIKIKIKLSKSRPQPQDQSKR